MWRCGRTTKYNALVRLKNTGKTYYGRVQQVSTTLPSRRPEMGAIMRASRPVDLGGRSGRAAPGVETSMRGFGAPPAPSSFRPGPPLAAPARPMVPEHLDSIILRRDGEGDGCCETSMRGIWRPLRAASALDHPWPRPPGASYPTTWAVIICGGTGRETAAATGGTENVTFLRIATEKGVGGTLKECLLWIFPNLKKTGAGAE